MSRISVQNGLKFELKNLSLLQKIALVVVGNLALILASQLAVPMVPVPIAMQTFAVTMIGALYGWRLGTITVLTWLGEAALGLPVLANGSGGLAVFVGPTAGYLVSFPIMTAMVGYLSQGFIANDRFLATSLLHLVANLLCLILGTLWIAALVGVEKAFIVGFVPFVLGAVLKSILAGACLAALGKKLMQAA